VNILLYHPKYVSEYTALLREREPELAVIPVNSEAEILKHIDEVDIIATHIGFPAEHLPLAKKLQWIQVLGAGVDRFVLSGTVPPGVVVTRVTGTFGDQISEYVCAFILHVLRQIPRTGKNQERKVWEVFVPQRLSRQTVGIAGVGNIGGEVARKLDCLGAKVYGMDMRDLDNPSITKQYKPEKLHDFLSQCDFVVSCLPLTAKTFHIFSAAEFGAMKPSAYFVNVARGDIVDQPALVKALQERAIAGAVLDVFENEPLPANSPLWELPGVYVTPHISGTALPEDGFTTFATNLDRFRRGEPLINAVDLVRGF